MKATRFYRNFLLPMAFAALAAACSTDEQPLAPQEITLTTPVLTLADASAGAAVSRAGEGTVPMEEVGLIYLYPQLTNGMGTEAIGTKGWYMYDESSWSIYNNLPLTVTSGPGAYYAAAYATVSLNAKEGERPDIVNLLYFWQGSLLVSEDGTFELDGAMTPRTAAIWVKLKDANGNDITGDTGLMYYSIRNTGLSTTPHIPYDIDLIDGSYGYEFKEDKNVYSIEATLNLGSWYPATYGTADGSWELFTINFHEGPYLNFPVLATYPVYYTGQLTLEAGKLYTFTVQLNGDKHATLVGNVSVSDFATGQQINIER